MSHKYLHNIMLNLLIDHPIYESCGIVVVWLWYARVNTNTPQQCLSICIYIHTCNELKTRYSCNYTTHEIFLGNIFEEHSSFVECWMYVGGLGLCSQVTHFQVFPTCDPGTQVNTWCGSLCPCEPESNSHTYNLCKSLYIHVIQVHACVCTCLQ